MAVGPPQDVFASGGGGGGGAGVTALNGEVGSLTITGSGGVVITTPTSSTINIDTSAITAGVTSLNTLTGAVVLAAGSGITLTPVGNTITIAATGGGAGVTSLNTLTGALSISSPDNFVSISTSGSTVRLSAGTGSYVTLSTDQILPAASISGNKQFMGAVFVGDGVDQTSQLTVDNVNGSSMKVHVISDIPNSILTTEFLVNGIGTIHGATNATPIVINYTLSSTAVAPQTGDKVVVSGVLGNTAANGNWVITVVDPTHFSLDGSVGNGAYTSGGTAYWDSSDDPEDSQATNAIRILDSPFFGFQPTCGIYFDTVGIGNRAGIIFGAGSVKPTGYGIDFSRLVTTVPIRLGNNTTIKGRNAANNADVALFGIDSSDRPTIDTFSYPTVDGAAGDVMTTDGAGHFSMQPPQAGVGVQSVWSGSTVTSSRALAGIYQNTSGHDMVVFVIVATTGAATTMTAVSDSSNPPTTQVSIQTTGTPGPAARSHTLIFVVKNNHFYSVSSVGGTPILNQWTEYTVTKGTFTDSGDLAGSRAYATAYQNTSGGLKIVAIQIGTGGTTTALSDSANPPVTTLLNQKVMNSGSMTIVFPVISGDYYEITNDGTGSITHWREYDWSAVTAARSASLSSRSMATSTGISGTYTNNTLKSMMAIVSAHSNAIATIYAVSNLSDSNSIPYVPNSMKAQMSGEANDDRTIMCLFNNGERFNPYIDAGALTTDTWWEWVIS